MNESISQRSVRNSEPATLTIAANQLDCITLKSTVTVTPTVRNTVIKSKTKTVKRSQINIKVYRYRTQYFRTENTFLTFVTTFVVFSLHNFIASYHSEIKYVKGALYDLYN